MSLFKRAVYEKVPSYKVTYSSTRKKNKKGMSLFESN